MMYEKSKLQSAFREYTFAIDSMYKQFLADHLYSKAMWERIDRATVKLRDTAKNAPQEIKEWVDRVLR
jgi:hypothetical protein